MYSICVTDPSSRIDTGFSFIESTGKFCCVARSTVLSNPKGNSPRHIYLSHFWARQKRFSDSFSQRKVVPGLRPFSPSLHGRPARIMYDIDSVPSRRRAEVNDRRRRQSDGWTKYKGEKERPAATLKRGSYRTLSSFIFREMRETISFFHN